MTTITTVGEQGDVDVNQPKNSANPDMGTRQWKEKLVSLWGFAKLSGSTSWNGVLSLLYWILTACEEFLRPPAREVYLMQADNYKVLANIGTTKKVLKRRPMVVDTGAGPNCISKSALSSLGDAVVKESPLYRVFDANGHPLSLVGTVSLLVEVGKCRVTAEFIVCDKLQVPIILGTDFTTRHVEAILCRKGYIQMTDGSQIPILNRKTGPRTETQAPGTENLNPTRPSSLIRVAQGTRLGPKTQRWLEVVCDQRGDIFISPSSRTRTIKGLIVANGVHVVKPQVPFRILVSNIEEKPIWLQKGTVIANAGDHPTWVRSTCLLITPKGVQPTNDVPQEENPTENGHEQKSEQPTDGGNEIDSLDLSILPTALQGKAKNLLRRYQHLWTGELGKIDVTEHAIELESGTKPVHQPPYRAGHRDRDFETQEVQKMLEKGVIRPSNSEWASPVVLAPKGDGSLRFCVDYRRLNAATKRDSYPLPRMDDCIDSLGDAQYFTTLDANSGYWQLPMREEDIPKTAFVTHDGLYEYLRMPFGLRNAPASFQRALNIILAGFNWQTCLVYIDDIIIYSKTAEAHLKDVESILEALTQAGVSLKFKKCLFFTDSVRYLGHIVRPGTLEIDQSHVKSLKGARAPRTPTELRSFLGFTNVYRRFINSFTDKARPLYALLKGNPKELPPLGKEEFQSFRTLVEEVTSAPILAIPKQGLRYSLDTDASKYQVGCALFQTHPDGTRKPIGFWSRKMTAAELNYSVSEQECLAVIYGITTCRPYLQGEQFDLYTDHNCIRWLMEIVDPSGRLMRWRLRLAEYTFDIHHKKGYLNTQADAVFGLASDHHTTELKIIQNHVSLLTCYRPKQS